MSKHSGVRDRLRAHPLGNQAVVEYRKRRNSRRVIIHGVTVNFEDGWPKQLVDGLYEHRYEAPEARVLERTLQRGDRYMELGASIGVMASLACRLAGEQNVTAYEANPRLADRARRTTAENGFSPTVINAAVGDSNAQRDFYIAENFLEGSLYPIPGARRTEVPGVAFADELARIDPTYLNVDIEGGEIAVLDARLPETLRAVCVEVHPGLVGNRAIQEMLLGLIEQGFVIDTEISSGQVWYLERA